MTLFFTSCSKEMVTENRKEMSHNIVKNVFEEGDIKISFPSIIDLNDIEIEELVNEILRQEAFRELSSFSDINNIEEKLSLIIDYEVLYQNENYLSIKFTGFSYLNNASYPRDIFATLNIDLKSGTRIQLKNIVNINNEFVDTIRDTLYEYIEKNPDWEVIYLDKLNYENDKFMKILNQADMELKMDCFSYITPEFLGISFATSHTAGDHFEIELKYEDIEGFLKVDLP